MKRTAAFLLGTGLVAPMVGMGLLSLSPTSGMDIFSTWRPSLRWWSALFTDASWLTAVGTSLFVAVGSASLALALALPPVMCWRLRPSRVLEGTLFFASLSYGVPPIVLAVGLYGMVMRAGLFDTSIGLALSHLAFTVPIAIFVLSTRFRATPLGLYTVARGLGATPLHAALSWLRSTQRGALAACFGAGILTSISEVTVTLYVTDTRVMTLARRALSGIARNIEPTGFAAMTMWLVIAAAVALPLARSMENGGRGNDTFPS